MFNVARQAFGNPFQSTAGSLLQPGAVGSVGRCPFCGNTIAVGGASQLHTGFNPIGIGALGQQPGISVPVPYSFSQGAGLGQINPLATQFGQGVPPTLQPMGTPGTGWQGLGTLAQQGIGGRTGAYGMDPRFAIGQQFGHVDPSVLTGWNPTIGSDPISSLFSQQVNPLVQQQLPIRPLIGAQQQGLGFQTSGVPGFATTHQWQDPYRELIEAQLISQLANNPFYQLQRAYGGVPELSNLPFAGQQFHPPFANVPF